MPAAKDKQRGNGKHRRQELRFGQEAVLSIGGQELRLDKGYGEVLEQR